MGVATMFRAPTGLGPGNRTGVKASMKGNKCYHVEVWARLICVDALLAWQPGRLNAMQRPARIQRHAARQALIFAFTGTYIL